jgi:hypothetical protein
MSEHYDSKEDLQGYFDLMDELDVVESKFFAQPWVKAILANRDVDNRNRVPMDGRIYPVTQTQYIMARKFRSRSSGDVQLYGYTLVPGDN